jgi:hypothetical protein
MIMQRISSLFILLIFGLGAFAQNGAYQTFKFININPSAKAISMGGVRVSQADNDLNSTLLNPALLNRENNQQASINYLNYIGDSHFGQFNYARQQKFGMLQASVLYYSGGNFVQTDETSTITGSFKVNETAFVCSWSKQLDSVLQVGVDQVMYTFYLRNVETYLLKILNLEMQLFVLHLLNLMMFLNLL